MVGGLFSLISETNIIKHTVHLKELENVYQNTSNLSFILFDKKRCAHKMCLVLVTGNLSRKCAPMRISDFMYLKMQALKMKDEILT